MGHKSGKGAVVPKTRADLEAELEKGYQIEVQKLARKYTKRSIETLARAQRHKLTPRQKEAGEELAPWPVRRQAARDLIEIGHGRAATQEPERHKAGITVIINQLTSDEQLEKVIPGKVVKAAQEIAATIDAEEVSHHAEGEGVQQRG